MIPIHEKEILEEWANNEKFIGATVRQTIYYKGETDMQDTNSPSVASDTTQVRTAHTFDEYEIFDGMEKINKAMHEKMMEKAPICHFRKMFYDQSDTTDGYYDEWWECSVCGHTKDINWKK